jgi:glycosyltransferase involved in cell wall biosynthesis
MRILTITNMYPPHHYGGYELLCLEFVTHLRGAGHEVLVLTSDIEVPGVAASTPDRDDVRRDLRLYWDDHVLLQPSIRQCLAIERSNQQALTRAIEEFRPDIVSVWHMGSLSLGLLTTCDRLGLPLVYVICDDWLVYGPVVDRWTHRWRQAGAAAAIVERALHVPCRLPDLGARGTFCFISDATRSEAERRGRWRYPRATVGYSGVNTEHFPVATSHSPRPWGWRLLVVGRVDDRKGFDTAIRSLPLLPKETTLDVIGRGDDRCLAELADLVDHLGLRGRVRFGVATREELATKYAAADAFLFTPRWAEPFGLVPLEAMACSTPVIATGTGGSGEFLLDGANCLRVPVDDHVAIAEAVERLAADDALRARLVTAGHVTARELSLSRWLELLEGWHRAAMLGHEAPPDRPPIAQVLEAATAAPRP